MLSTLSDSLLNNVNDLDLTHANIKNPTIPRSTVDKMNKKRMIREVLVRNEELIHSYLQYNYSFLTKKHREILLQYIKPAKESCSHKKHLVSLLALQYLMYVGIELERDSITKVKNISEGGRQQMLHCKFWFDNPKWFHRILTKCTSLK